MDLLYAENEIEAPANPNGPSGAGKSTLFDLILCFYFIAQLLQQYDSYLGESGVRLTGG